MNSGSLQDRWDSSAPMVFSGAPTPQDIPALTDGEIAFATSGSTGEPKFVVHSHASLEASASMVNRHLGAIAGDRWLVALPSYHVGGFGVHVRAWQLGSVAIELGERWRPADFVQSTRDHQIAWSSLVPAQVSDLVDLGESAPEQLRGIIVGGGTLTPAIAAQAHALGWPVVQSYGMTETGSQVATGLPTEPFSPTLPILQGWEARVPSGGTGLLELRGAALAHRLLHRKTDGHWRSTQLTDSEGWFSTSDHVELDGSDQLTWKGRADSMVKVLGELVSLDLLQTELDALSPNAVIIDLPSDRDRELVLALEPGSADAEGLLERFNADRPGFQRVSRHVILDSPLPRSGLGKLRRSELRELLLPSRTEP